MVKLWPMATNKEIKAAVDFGNQRDRMTLARLDTTVGDTRHKEGVSVRVVN